MQYLLIKICKVKKGVSPTIMNEIFQFFENPVYELSSGVHLPSRNSRTTFFGTESIMNLGAQLWNMVPENIKSSELLNVFKSKIKYGRPNQCPRRICKTFVDEAGFINLTFVFVEFTICLTYLFFNDYILNMLFEIIVKIFNPFVLKIYLFIVPYNNDCTI